MTIQLDTVLQTIDTTKTVVQSIKTVCKNNEQYTSYISDENIKSNVKVQAERMLTMIETCEQKIEDVTDTVKKKFDKLSEDIFGVQSKYGNWLKELNEWLGIHELEKEMINERLSQLAEEFPNSSRYYKGQIADRINLYIIAIGKKIEELIQKLYDVVQEWVEEQIQKLKEWIDPYLKKLKEFGDSLVNKVKDWIGDFLDFSIDSEFGKYAKASYELAQGLLEQLGLEVPESLGNILPLPGKESSTEVEQKIDNEKSYKEGLFTGKPDPRSPDYLIDDGLGMKEQEKVGNVIFNVPKQQFNTEYTKQFPTVTPGGHIEDKDDTPGYERYFRQHPSGTFTEEQPNGTTIRKIVGEKYEIIDRDGNIQIKGNCNLIVGQGVTINVAGDAHISVGGNSVQLIRGNAKQTICGNSEQKINGNVFEYIIGNVKQKIDGNVDSCVVGNVNQKIDGSAWQYIKGNSEQVIDGNSKQYIRGNSEQFIDGNTSQQIKGKLIQKVSGNVEQTLQSNVRQNVSGNFDLTVGGQFKLNSSQTTLQQSGETTITGSRIQLN